MQTEYPMPGLPTSAKLFRRTHLEGRRGAQTEGRKGAAAVDWERAGSNPPGMASSFAMGLEAGASERHRPCHMGT